MKLKITLKDPDRFYDAVQEAAKESLDIVPDLDSEEKETLLDGRTEKIWNGISQWVEYQEYITIEFDTEANTATVLPK